MNITCPHCKAKLNIPDNRIPKDKNSFFKCPKCQDKIQMIASQLNFSATDSVKNKGVKREFSEVMGKSVQGGDHALICIDDPAMKAKSVNAVQELGFYAEVADSISWVFKKMAYHIYPLVLVDESFDKDKGFKSMASHMNELDMSLRRRICLVLFSKELTTGDPMSALHSSVNYILGPDSLSNLENILSTALTEHQDFYTVYNESMRAAGKA